LDALQAESQFARVTIAHRLATILSADTVAVMQAGHVVEAGTPADLRQAGGAFEEMMTAFR